MSHKRLLRYWIDKYKNIGVYNLPRVRGRLTCYFALVNFTYSYKGSPLLLTYALHPDFNPFWSVTLGKVAKYYEIFK